MVNCRRLRRVLEEEISTLNSSIDNLELNIKAKQVEKIKADREIGELKLGFLSGNKRKLWDERKRKLGYSIASVNEDLRILSEELSKIQGRMTEYTNIEKRFEVNSDYRKLLSAITDIANTHYDKMNEVVRDKGFYDRTGELTDDVQLKLMQKILIFKTFLEILLLFLEILLRVAVESLVSVN